MQSSEIEKKAVDSTSLRIAESAAEKPASQSPSLEIKTPANETAKDSYEAKVDWKSKDRNFVEAEAKKILALYKKQTIPNLKAWPAEVKDAPFSLSYAQLEGLKKMRDSI